MTTDINLWVISDGRRGIENQALGLAEACQHLVACDISVQTTAGGKPFKVLPAALQSRLQKNPADYGLTPPFPDIAIGCGRQAIAPLIALKQSEGDNIFTVYVQDPRIAPDAFDLVIAPEHDELTGDNVIQMIGSPNRITNNRIIEGVFEHENKLAMLPMPRAAMLIGGDSKTHKLDRISHAAHMRTAGNILASERSLLITTSRRTPDFAVQAYRELATLNNHVWLYEGQGPNPYFAFLGGADTILVTEDSTNMLTEACTTGKTVFRLPMSGEAGKFQNLYDRLQKRCGVHSYETLFTAQKYDPLQETDRVAEILLNRYNKNKA